MLPFIFPLLLALDVVASSTPEYSMDAVRKNMNRIQGYMQNRPPHLPSEDNTTQRQQTPHPHTQLQAQVNKNTPIQDKAKLIELLSKVQLTEEEKQENLLLLS